MHRNGYVRNDRAAGVFDDSADGAVKRLSVERAAGHEQHAEQEKRCWTSGSETKPAAHGVGLQTECDKRGEKDASHKNPKVFEIVRDESCRPKVIEP